jgi:hypothetical protein
LKQKCAINYAGTYWNGSDGEADKEPGPQMLPVISTH